MLMRVPHFAHFAIIGILGITLLLLTGRVEAMPMRFTNWKTIPVGRYLVDVPENATLTFYPSIQSYSFTILEGSATDARSIVQKRIDDLKKTQHETEGSMFIRSIVLENNAILIQSYELEHYTGSIWIDIYYVAKLKDKDIIYHYSNSILDSDFNSPKLQQYLDLAANLRPLEDGVIPETPGLCMGNIMLLGTGSFPKEDVSVKIQYADIKGFTMALKTTTAIINYKELLDFPNVVKNEYYQLEPYKNGKTLRKGDHSVGGKYAQELCVAGDSKKFHYRKYSFIWGAIPKKPPFNQPLNMLTPYIRAVLTYRGDPYTDDRPIRPFPSDDVALAVWDRFVNSVRVRPVVMEKK